MKKKRKTPEAVFKEYNQEQGWLFPPNVNEMVPDNHLVRTISTIVDSAFIRNPEIPHVLNLIWII